MSQSFGDVSQPLPETASVPAQAKNRKRGTPVCRFRWTSRMENDLVTTILDFKVEQDAECKDMEPDLVTFYGELRKRMAGKYHE